MINIMKLGMEIINVEKGNLNTSYGEFTLYCFLIRDNYIPNSPDIEHLALVKGNEKTWRGSVLCRVNSACITSEVFNCNRCDCKWQLDKAMETISLAGQGIITYHSHHEGRGFGLPLKLLSYNKMDEGYSSSESYLNLGLGSEDRRDYRAAGVILDYFNVRSVSLISNNERKTKALESFGIKIVSRKSVIYDGENEKILNYLRKKSEDPEQEMLRDNLIFS